MQEVRRRTYEVLRLLVNLRFQILFHSPLGVLFTFPSLYLFTIGHQGIFSLTGWSPQIPIEFHVFDGTQDTAKAVTIFEYGAITLFGQSFQTVVLTVSVPHCGPTTPHSN